MFSLIHSSLTEILTLIFIGVVLIQVCYYCFLFFRFSFHKKEHKPNIHQYPISIVITAKNQAHHLLETLPTFLAQEYPSFEIVIVSDKSTDETEMLVKEFQQKHPNITIKFIDLTSSVTNIKGKKFPISIGIKSATHKHIILTDPDCKPASIHWLTYMARNFTPTKNIIIGFSTTEPKRGLTNKLIRYDNLHNAIQYFSFALAKMPYMGVGKNLAYTQEIFYNRKGFAGLTHLQSGDDDLFINQVATAQNCAIEYSPKSHIYSSAISSAYSWLTTKRFRYSIRNLFSPKVRFSLTIYGFSNPLFYLLFALSLYTSIITQNNLFLIITLATFLFKQILQYIAFGFAAAKLNEKKLIPYILFFDILLTFTNAIIYLKAKFSNKK